TDQDSFDASPSVGRSGQGVANRSGLADNAAHGASSLARTILGPTLCPRKLGPRLMDARGAADENWSGGHLDTEAAAGLIGPLQPKPNAHMDPAIGPHMAR